MGRQKSRYGCNVGHDYRPPARINVPDAVGISRAVRAIDAIADITNRTPEEIRACIIALRELSQEDFDIAMETSQIDRLTNRWED